MKKFICVNKRWGVGCGPFWGATPSDIADEFDDMLVGHTNCAMVAHHDIYEVYPRSWFSTFLDLRDAFKADLIEVSDD